MSKDCRAEVKKVTALSKTAFDILLFTEEIAKSAKPGQFISIGCGEGLLLRRPISICDASAAEGTVRIVFEVRGEGTKWLSERKEGELLSVLGPLGNGFRLGESLLPSLFIGGGIGTPPIFFAAKHMPGENDIVVGFRCGGAVIMENELKTIAEAVTVCTDDGSYGVHGLVTAEAEKLIEKKQYGAIFACGPKPMLRAVAALAKTNGIRCQISLEERMGCSVGACLVCACAVKGENGTEYKHVCKDGPVFDAEEVEF